MKHALFTSLICLFTSLLFAQKNKQQYPTPEYNNEIYLFKKDSIQLLRLEKGNSKIQSKTKMGGMRGGESAYTIEGGKSSIRLKSGQNLYFIFFTGETRTTTSEADSAMMKSGLQPGSFPGDPMSMLTDPSRTTTLYNMNVDKGNRMITIQSYNGMKLLGKSKKESIKYTLSIKKVREGYYEMFVDKPLPNGEYAFLINSMTSMDGSSQLFAFGVD